MEVFMNNTVTDGLLTVCRISDAPRYLPKINRSDADADFYNDVSRNSSNIHAICYDREVIGLSCIIDDPDAYVYVYIFPQYRGKGYGSSRHGDDMALERTRKRVHAAIAIVMLCVIVIFNAFSSSGVITLIFTMASYTYGPLLGLFAFGILTRRSVRGAAIPFIAIVAPAACYMLSTHSTEWLGGYQFSYELIILNGALTMLGLWIFSRKESHHA